LFLDTRTKIIPLHELLARLESDAARWVCGYFDPLLAEHVRKLAQAREPGRLLVVEVTNPPQPLLGQRARAELVAALSMVDYVVLGEGREDSPADADITERFIGHVLDRHRISDRHQQEAR
jgi:bifunctional ADP-heptose synthase (sugar kinase/adenylyltransferase)